MSIVLAADVDSIGLMDNLVSLIDQYSATASRAVNNEEDVLARIVQSSPTC
jgi:hypothetical protein